MQVSLMTFDEDEYRVEEDVARDHGLDDLLRKHVRLWGRVQGGRVIRVDRIEIMAGSSL